MKIEVKFLTLCVKLNKNHIFFLSSKAGSIAIFSEMLSIIGP